MNNYNEYKNHPILNKFIPSNLKNEQSIIFFNSILDVYKEFEENKKIIDFDIINYNHIKNIFNNLIIKTNDKPLIPKHNIESLLKYINDNIEISFYDFKELIDDYYWINIEDVFKFNDNNIVELKFKEEYNLTNIEYNKICKTRPSDDKMAMRLYLLNFIYREIDILPYVNFLDNFIESNNISYIYNTKQLINIKSNRNKKYIINNCVIDGVNVTFDIFDYIRKIIFKELKQCDLLSKFNYKQISKMVKFHFYW